MAVNLVLPPVSESQVAHDLRWLTQTLLESGVVADNPGGGLGGEFGYGVDFENDVFEMHPYYWGDCVCGHEQAEGEWWETHEHAGSCYQQVLRARGYLDCGEGLAVSSQGRREVNDRVVAQVCGEMGLDPDFGALVHCTCTHAADFAAWVQVHGHDPACGIVRPNFRHKPSGSQVRFYKYLGRGMEVDLRVAWASVVAGCVASLG